VVAFAQLVWSAAIPGSLLGNRLVEARGGSAAAMAPQQNPGDARLLAQKLGARLDVEGVGFEVHRRLVVVRPGIDAQHHESAPRQLARRRTGKNVRGAVNDEDRDMRGRTRIGL